MQDIHDIKPLMSVDFPWVSFIIALLIMIGGLILFTWLIAKLFKRRKAPIAETPIARVIKPEGSPRKQALKSLKALRKQNLPPERFYVQLEKIMKVFLADLHEEPLRSATSQELMLFLQMHAHVPLDELDIGHLFLRGQQAKFAAEQISSQLMGQDIEHAEAFVNRYTSKG